MVKKINKTKSSFFESRRTFLKGTAYTVGGAVVAKGIFSTVLDTPAYAEETKFTATPQKVKPFQSVTRKEVGDKFLPGTLGLGQNLGKKGGEI